MTEDDEIELDETFSIANMDDGDLQDYLVGFGE
jgi:hypothetical protein